MEGPMQGVGPVEQEQLKGLVHDGEAESRLKEGALGIGEHHDKPAGRQLVLDLIKKGKVSHLFVELPTTWQPIITKAQEAYAEIQKKNEQLRQANKLDEINPKRDFDTVWKLVPEGTWSAPREGVQVES